MLNLATRRGRVAAVCVALALATSSIAVLSIVPSAASVEPTMLVAPSLGLGGLTVRFSGDHVPAHLTYSVLFDLTTKDKVLLCTGTDGTHTTWQCSGRIPQRYGALGEHTVEMDAVTTTGRGDFEELSSFLVSDLGVLMSAPPSSAPGDAVALRVTVSNGNAKGARGVEVTDQLPSGLRFERVTAPCTATKGGLVRCGPFRMHKRSQREFQISTLVTAAGGARLLDVVHVRGVPDPLGRNDRVRVVVRVA